MLRSASTNGTTATERSDERRMAADGNSYTNVEFMDWYSNYADPEYFWLHPFNPGEAGIASDSAGQPVTGSSHRTTEQWLQPVPPTTATATEHSHAPQASATAAEHGSERWLTVPAAADKWQVKFPSGWWDLPPEASAEIHQQYLRGEATAAYMQCRSKKRDEWQPYRIDFIRMEQTNTVSGRTRMARCIPTVADVADKATSSMEPANYGVWQEPCSAAEPL